MGVSEFNTLLQLFLQTAPLTIAVAVIVTGIGCQWKLFYEGPYNIMSPALIFSLTTTLGNALGAGIGPVKPIDIVNFSGTLGQSFSVFVNLMGGYVKVYGIHT